MSLSVCSFEYNFDFFPVEFAFRRVCMLIRDELAVWVNLVTFISGIFHSFLLKRNEKFYAYQVFHKMTNRDFMGFLQ